MNSKLIAALAFTILGGCTFKSEINDQRNESKDTLQQDKDVSESELQALGAIEFYSLQKSTGGEFKRSVSFLENDDGELLLSEPLFLPSGDVSLSMNFKSQHFSNHVVDLASIENQESKQSSILAPMEGSGGNDVDYQLNTENLSRTSENLISMQVSAHDNRLNVLGLVYESPKDISISFVSPPDPKTRDQAKDKFTEDGTFYYLHDLVLHNAHPFPIEIEVPTVMAASYLVRGYQDLEVPNQAARNIDQKKCGSAVSISRDFKEKSLSTIGVYLLPTSLKSDSEIKKYVSQSSSVVSLNGNESLHLSLFAEGRSDLGIAGEIFIPPSSNRKRIVSGCTPKKAWVDDGRDWQNRFGDDEEVRLYGGYYIYYGEPQYSNVNLQSGISRVFMDFNNPQNKSFKVRPVGDYENTILNVTPSSLFKRRLLYSNGVE
jgi:hypothetical protein